MFTAGGQLDLLTFGGMRGGGGKGGGGGQQQPPQGRTFVDPVDGTVFTESPWDAMMGKTSASDAYNQHLKDRRAQEAATSQTNQQAADAKAAADTTAFQGKRQSAYDTALQQVQRRFQLEGVDPNTYMTSDIQPTLQRQFASIPDNDPNPFSAFPTSLGDTIVGDVLSGKRTQALNSLNSTFTPDYASRLLPDETVSQFAPGILDEQFNPLTSQLENAYKRHTLNDTGYKAALDTLGQKRSAATSTVNNLGRSILENDRTSLNDLITGARNDVSNLTLGQGFDPSAYTGRAASRAQSELGSFGSDLRSKIGDTKFADLPSLLNAGGAVQGATNPSAANPTGGVLGTSPFFVPPEEEASKKRGLGNTGAF